jgi:hypothetical protein
MACLLCNRSVARLRSGDVAGSRSDGDSAVRLVPSAPRPHARLGDAAACSGDWGEAVQHYASALGRCEPGSAAAMDAGSRLTLASNGGRGSSSVGGGGGAGGTPLVQSPAASPAGSPLLGPGSDGRSLSSAALLDALSLGGGKRRADPLQEGPPVTVRDGASPSKSPKRSRPSTPVDGASTGDDAAQRNFEQELAAAFSVQPHSEAKGRGAGGSSAQASDYERLFGDGEGELSAAVDAFSVLSDDPVGDYLLAAFVADHPIT